MLGRDDLRIVRALTKGWSEKKAGVGKKGEVVTASGCSNKQNKMEKIACKGFGDAYNAPPTVEPKR